MDPSANIIFGAVVDDRYAGGIHFIPTARYPPLQLMHMEEDLMHLLL
jgi:hypothetical protein